MAVPWRGGELGVELAGDEPGMVRDLDDLDQLVVQRPAREAHPGVLHAVQVAVVELVAVAVTLADLGLAVDRARQAAGLEPAVLPAQAHGAAQVRGLVAGLHPAPLVAPLGDQSDHRVRRLAVELGAVGALQPGHVAGILDHRDLHAQTDAEVGDAPLPGEARGRDLALDAPLAETARHQDGVHRLQRAGALLLDRLGVDIDHLDLDPRVHAGMGERLGEGLVGLGEVHVLADHGDAHPRPGMVEAVHHPSHSDRSAGPTSSRNCRTPARRAPGRAAARGSGRCCRRPPPRSPRPRARW